MEITNIDIIRSGTIESASRIITDFIAKNRTNILFCFEKKDMAFTEYLIQNWLIDTSDGE